jgi:threonine synthase
VVLVPQGTPSARINPLLLYGATVIRYPGSIDAAFEVLAEVSATGLAMDVSTIRQVNPFQAEAPRTIAFEIVSQLGDAPDWVIVPTGGGGTLAGIARGFGELHVAGLTTKSPALVAVQPSAYNTLERAVAQHRTRYSHAHQMEIATDEPTVLSKLAHTFPPDGLEALEAIRASNGTAVSVSDVEALRAQVELGRREGLFIEPSAGAGPAGLHQLVARGTIGRNDRVVICLTGSGFRVQDELDVGALGAVVDGPAGLDAGWLVNVLTGDGHARST